MIGKRRPTSVQQSNRLEQKLVHGAEMAGPEVPTLTAKTSTARWVRGHVGVSVRSCGCERTRGRVCEFECLKLVCVHARVCVCEHVVVVVGGGGGSSIIAGNHCAGYQM